MSVTSATSAGLANFSNSSTGVQRTPTQSLGETDFLKLLSVQFQQQDPLKPMDDTAFIAQTAQFTSLQQMTQLNQQQQMMTGTGYIGRTVTVQDNNGNLITGLVTALDNTGAAPELVLNGSSYPLTSVKRIESSTAAPTGATPASADPGTSASTGSSSSGSSTGTTATGPTGAAADPTVPAVVPTPTNSPTTAP